MSKSVSIEPHWPSLARFFEHAASVERNRVKRAEFKRLAAEIRAYLAANPDKDN